MVNTDKRCGSCRHFRQHYIKVGRRFTEIFCGHCVYPRLKKRDPLHKTCEHYKPET